ncbi:hypothetical protein AB1Y20_020191 [Prymnesium parvum]|uniref:EF-hand domain-containing protein n=1 Tax=Prymnesium parvum TaxID=97485 RepID=A0AB34JX80_PRYPA
MRVRDLFLQWDADGSGAISRKEFRQAVKLLEFDGPASEINAVFDSFDVDGNGEIDFKELNKHLRSGADIDLVQRRLQQESMKRAKSNDDFRERHGVSGVSGVACATNRSVQEQLRALLRDNAMRVSDLFRQWDADGSGAISRKEFRQAVKLLEFDGPASEINAVFDSFDVDGNGEIDFKELNKHLRSGADIDLVQVQQRRLQQESMKRAKSNDDFRERHGVSGVSGVARATNKHTLWSADDCKPTGQIVRGHISAASDRSVQEQLRALLRDNAMRVSDLFRQWDADGSGAISRKEFRQAVKLLEFDGPASEINAVFDSFDVDGNGEIDFKELNKHLRSGADIDLVQVQQRRLQQESMKRAKSNDDFRERHGVSGVSGVARATNKHTLWSADDCKPTGQIVRGQISAASDRSVQEQLRALLRDNAMRVSDLFRQWDADGSGAISRKEFRQAVKLLEFDGPASEINAVFDSFDVDGNGEIDFKELNKHLRSGADIDLSLEQQGETRFFGMMNSEPPAMDASLPILDGSSGCIADCSTSRCDTLCSSSVTPNETGNPSPVNMNAFLRRLLGAKASPFWELVRESCRDGKPVNFSTIERAIRRLRIEAADEDLAPLHRFFELEAPNGVASPEHGMHDNEEVAREASQRAGLSNESLPSATEPAAWTQSESWAAVAWDSPASAPEGHFAG